MKKETLTTGDYELHIWQMSPESKAKTFKSKLFEAISKADLTNLNKLALGFPEEVKAYRNFINDEHYWKNLQNILGK